MDDSLLGNSYLWSEKYRPQKIEDIILDEVTLQPFKKFVEEKQIPHLLLSGTPGVGKTTIARAICNELGIDFMFINASMEASIDLLRDKVTKFARTVSLAGRHSKKCVIFDEADNVPSRNFFDSLRPMIEQYTNNCIFIFTCNYVEKVPPAIQSRTQSFDFQIQNKKTHATKILQRIEFILNNEKIQYDIKNVVAIIKKYFPDIRKILNVLQQNEGFLQDEKLMYKLEGINVEPLIKAMKEKNYNDIKEFIITKIQFSDTVYRQIYDSIEDFVQNTSKPAMILMLDDFQRTHTQAIDKEVHLLAMCLDMAGSISFK